MGHSGTGGNKSLLQMKVAIRYSKYQQVFIERFSSSSGDLIELEDPRDHDGKQPRQYTAQEDIISSLRLTQIR